jgi:hypothetical protein
MRLALLQPPPLPVPGINILQDSAFGTPSHPDPGSGAFYPLGPDPGKFIVFGSRIPDLAHFLVLFSNVGTLPVLYLQNPK